MRIESLQFVKATDLKKERFDFSSEKLNVLITPTGFGRSMIAEAIWSILYGHENRDEKEENSRIRAGILKARVGQRSYVVSRDFADDRTSFRELNGIEAEPGFPHVEAPGRVLCGLGIDVFRDVCMMEERKRSDGKRLSLADRLSSLLSRTKDSDEGPDKGIACIEDALQNYHFKNRNCKIDDLITGLERGRLVLVERLRGLEQEKIESSERLRELTELENEIAERTQLIKREEHFQLCLAVADLDSRILNVQERLLMETELQRELQELGDLSDFPVDVVRKVDELWTKRESTLLNYARLAHDADEASRVSSGLDLFLSEFPDLEKFVSDDAQSLYGLARTLESVQGELEELNLRQTEEMRKVKSSGMDFDKVALVRKSLLSMETHDLDEATSLAQQLKKGKQDLSDAVQVTQRVERDIAEAREELDRALKTERRWRNVLLGVIFSPLAFLLAAILGRSETWARGFLIVVSVTVTLTAATLSILFLVLLYRNKKNLGARLERIIKEYKELSQSEVGVSSQLSEVQRRADKLAQQYEVSSGVELLKQITSYAGSSSKLKDLDLLDQIIASREKQLNKIGAEIEKHFLRAGRSGTATPLLAVGLADDVQRYREQLREQEKVQTLLNHKKSELRFLEGEIKDIDSQLRDAFYRARLDEPEELTESIGQFREKAIGKKRYDTIHRELERRENDRTAEMLDSNLASLLEVLQEKRQEAWSRMQELVTANPFLTDQASPAAETPGPAKAAELMRQVEVLRLHYQDTREQIRLSANNFDDYYPKTQHELELLDRDLARIQHHKRSLDLASSLLGKVAAESRSSWSNQLSRNAALMLSEAGMEFENIDWDEHLGIRLRLRGHEEVIGEDELEKRLSRGMLSQVDWIVRMAVALVVCETDSIPVVLDEPFARIDDQRFLSSMKLLIKLLPRLQVIVLSCHQLRHQWLMQQLSDEEQSMLHFCSAEEGTAP